MQTFKYISNSENDTINFAKKLAKNLRKKRHYSFVAET